MINYVSDTKPDTRIAVSIKKMLASVLKGRLNPNPYITPDHISRISDEVAKDIVNKLILKAEPGLLQQQELNVLRSFVEDVEASKIDLTTILSTVVESQEFLVDLSKYSKEELLKKFDEVEKYRTLWGSGSSIVDRVVEAVHELVSETSTISPETSTISPETSTISSEDVTKFLKTTFDGSSVYNMSDITSGTPFTYTLTVGEFSSKGYSKLIFDNSGIKNANHILINKHQKNQSFWSDHNLLYKNRSFLEYLGNNFLEENENNVKGSPSNLYQIIDLVLGKLGLQLRIKIDLNNDHSIVQLKDCTDNRSNTDNIDRPLQEDTDTFLDRHGVSVNDIAKGLNNPMDSIDNPMDSIDDHTRSLLTNIKSLPAKKLIMSYITSKSFVPSDLYHIIVYYIKDPLFVYLGFAPSSTIKKITTTFGGTVTGVDTVFNAKSWHMLSDKLNSNSLEESDIEGIQDPLAKINKALELLIDLSSILKFYKNDIIGNGVSEAQFKVLLDTKLYDQNIDVFGKLEEAINNLTHKNNAHLESSNTSIVDNSKSIAPSQPFHESNGQSLLDDGNAAIGGTISGDVEIINGRKKMGKGYFDGLGERFDISDDLKLKLTADSVLFTKFKAFINKIKNRTIEDIKKMKSVGFMKNYQHHSFEVGSKKYITFTFSDEKICFIDLKTNNK